MKAVFCKIGLYCMILSSCASTSKAQEEISWINPHSIDCTVLIEKWDKNQFIPHGTGFLLYNYNDSVKPILITNAHILKNQTIYVTIPASNELKDLLHKNNIKGIILGKSKWAIADSNLRLEVKLKLDSSFVIHKSLDIGAVPIDLYSTALFGHKNIKVTSKMAIPRSLMIFKKDIGLGANVYFVGFPFGIGTESGFMGTNMYNAKVANPVVRSGSIAWKADASPEFLLDALSYGGNSGSPIFLKEQYPLNGMLIGIIFGHLGPTIYDKNTGSVVLEDNWGLANCIWIDDILTVYNKATKL